MAYDHYQQYLWHYWSPKLVRIKIYLPLCFLFVSQGLLDGYFSTNDEEGCSSCSLSVLIWTGPSCCCHRSVWNLLELPQIWLTEQKYEWGLWGAFRPCMQQPFPCPPSCWVQTFMVCCLLWSRGFLECSVLQVVVWTRGRDFESSDKGTSLLSRCAEPSCCHANAALSEKPLEMQTVDTVLNNI